MSSIELVQVGASVLRDAACTFGSGIQTVLGTERDGTHELASLIAGLSHPRRGTVRVLGTDPYRSPETRKRLGALLGSEPAPPVSVESALRDALGLRGAAGELPRILEQFGFSSIRIARADKLPPSIWRDVVLALALSVPNPLALVLVEPLATGLGRERVRGELARISATGAAVLALTASPLDASELGGPIVLLDQGRFVRRPGTPLALELAPGGSIALRVRANDARKLAGRLAEHAAVSSLEWRGEGNELTLRGDDPSELGLAIARTARELEVTVTSIEPVLPGLDETRGATAGLWRAAYEAAYRIGQEHARARAEAWRAAAQAAVPASVPAPAPPAVQAPSVPPPSIPPTSGGTP